MIESTKIPPQPVKLRVPRQGRSRGYQSVLAPQPRSSQRRFQVRHPLPEDVRLKLLSIYDSFGYDISVWDIGGNYVLELAYIEAKLGKSNPGKNFNELRRHFRKLQKNKLKMGPGQYKSQERETLKIELALMLCKLGELDVSYLKSFLSSYVEKRKEIRMAAENGTLDEDGVRHYSRFVREKILKMAETLCVLGERDIAFQAINPLLENKNHVLEATRLIARFGDVEELLGSCIPLLSSGNFRRVHGLRSGRLDGAMLCLHNWARGMVKDPMGVNNLLRIVRLIGALGAPKGLETLKIIIDAVSSERGPWMAQLQAEIIDTIGEIGHPKGIELLEHIFSIPGFALDHNRNQRIAKALGLIGHPKGIAMVEELVQRVDPEYRESERKNYFRGFLPAFVDNYKPEMSEEAPSQNPLRREAALLRAICADKYREERFEYARGFLNQGIRPGSRPDSLGYDFREYRRLQNGEPITGRVDWNATARTGKVMEKRYQQPQASKVTIVIDPKCFRDNNPDRNKNLRLLAGAIAQMALQRKDMVGLVIGKKQVYIKPSHDKSRLLEILTRIASYTNLQADVTIPELLEQPTVRQNMPHEAEIFFISTFEDSNLEGFGKIAAKLRKGRVHLTPIKVDNKIVMPYPVVEIGGMKYRIYKHIVDNVAGELAAETSLQIEGVLKINKGCLFDIGQVEKDSDIPIAVISQLTQPTETRNLQVNSRVSFEGEQVIKWGEESSFAELSEILSTYNREEDGGTMLYKLKLHAQHGGGLLFRYVKNELDNCFGINEASLNKDELAYIEWLRKDFRGIERNWMDIDYLLWRPSEWKDIRLPIEICAKKKLGHLWLSHWGPHNYLFTFFLKFKDRMDVKKRELKRIKKKEKARKGILSRLFKRNKAFRIPNLTSDSLSPADSGVDKPKTKEDEKIWQTVKPAPYGNAYLRNFIGIDLNSRTCEYSGKEELSLDRFDAGGSKKAVGKLSAESQVNISDLPRPVGGKIEKVDGKNIYYELGNREPEQVSRLKKMKLSEFKKMAKQVYGKEIYRALTDTIALEDLDETTRAEWEAVLNQVENLTVKDTIKLIRSYIISHPNIRYHRYIPEEEGGEVKQVLFGEFKERAARGEAQGKDEHLLFALQAGGGVCVEMAKITKTLLRLAGIPTALSSGWIAENGKVKVEGHTWAEVVFPKKGGKWYGEPVETSTVYLRKEIISAAKKIVKLFKQKEEKRKEEEAVPPEVKAVTKFVEALPKETHIPQVVSRLPEIWLQADHAKRIQISNWIRELPSLLDFADSNWPGTNVNVAELILKDWRNHVQAYPKQAADRMPVLEIPKDKERMDLVSRWAGILEQIV
jgi:hypothetical protein